MFRTLVLLLCLAVQSAMAQPAIRHGVGIPTRDTLRILIVFAEVDFKDGPCPSNLTEDFAGSWPRDRQGTTQPPTFAGAFLDREIAADGKMEGFITRYYHEASFGSYILLGDYLPEVVTVPCKDIRVGNHGLAQILERLSAMRPQAATLLTAGGYPLSAFDIWSTGKSGQPKLKEPDGNIDLLYIIWRNNRMLTSVNTIDYAGFGVTGARGKPFKDMQGVSNMASFNARGAPEKAMHITVAEHLHGIFGGNHWHSAGGRGMHTFLMPGASYGLTAQAGGTMLAASGWDRWMMDWKHPDKQFTISALNADGEEVDTDRISIDTHPDGGTLILRDHITSGDAIRIKLPFLDWEKMGDVKNQYIWLENRRMTADTDRYLAVECANNGDGRFPRGTPGIYAYLQVGKDMREGDGIYSSTPEHPNGLASPFLPLPAEGRFDFHFRHDRIQPGDPGQNCNWGNENIPKDMRRSRPNPLTGMSDLYSQIDYNRDGKMYSGDRIYTGLSKMRADSAVHDYHMNGDWLDAFAPSTGRMEMSLSTNPAPLPVYTYGSNLEFGRYTIRDSVLSGFENRVIHLNGLSLKFNELDNGDMRVSFRWDDYELRDHVRWCGTIVQHPHFRDVSLPSLKVGQGRRLMLERGETAQYHEARGKDRRGNWLFADPTMYKVSSGAVMELENRARVLVNDDSSLIFEPGSRLVLNDRSRIVVAKGATFVIPDGVEVSMGKGARIIRK